MTREEEARELIKNLFKNEPEQEKLAYEAMEHTKDCQLCKLIARFMDEIILKHMEESREALR